MDKDICVIKIEIPSSQSEGYKPVSIPVPYYNQIKSIADDTGKSLSRVALELLDFALERVEIRK